MEKKEVTCTFYQFVRDEETNKTEEVDKSESNKNDRLFKKKHILDMN